MIILNVEFMNVRILNLKFELGRNAQYATHYEKVELFLVLIS